MGPIGVAHGKAKKNSCANRSTVWFTESPTGLPDGTSVFFGQRSRAPGAQRAGTARVAASFDCPPDDTRQAIKSITPSKKLEFRGGHPTHICSPTGFQSESDCRPGT